MPIPKEICVFFPCHTLEDFPTHLRDDSADGLLAGWLAPWHPEAIAAIAAIPTWNRADTPPVDLQNRLLLIPSAAESRLPSDLQQRVGDALSTRMIRVTTLEDVTKEILQILEIPQVTLQAQRDYDDRIADFRALGYAYLQVQLMTRQLRYSSNLDLVVFAEHVVEAAKAWVAADDVLTGQHLQSAFDRLAEERDHYFSSDPHLVDLMLVAESTTGPELLESLQGDSPLTLLVCAAVAEQIAKDFPAIADRIRLRHAEGTLSVIGGSPNDLDRLEVMDGTELACWLAKSLDRTEAALGIRPIVFARLGGGIPGDLPPWLIEAGFRGAVTSDFQAGTGSQSESKMLWQAGGIEIEALTAQPQDITQPHTFLGIGPRLGEAADSGQVSAALLVRWPGIDSPYLDALRRVAKFGLSMGRFWTLDEFFTKGERPYHTCTLPAATCNGAALTQATEQQIPNPLSSTASAFAHTMEQQALATAQTLLRLMTGDGEASALVPTVTRLCQALGMETTSNAGTAAHLAVVNLSCGPTRSSIEMKSAPPANAAGLFRASKVKGSTLATVDTPGIGFSTFLASSKNQRDNPGWFGWLKPAKKMAHGNSLTNEFLDVAIHPESGGIAAVHCGMQRGNRYSWQLAHYDAEASGDGYSQMECQKLRVLSADTARGTIEAVGRLIQDKKTVGEFSIQYGVETGSRWIDIAIEVNLSNALKANPWRSYVAGRAAWSSDALSVRPLIRSKRHRATGKFLESPLGVVIDEGDRQLQVCSYGLPAHRRVGSKRLDTLLVVRDESQRKFRLAYGFDVPAPLRSAIQRIQAPTVIPLADSFKQPLRGWLVDLNSKSVLATEWQALGSDLARCRIVETSGKPTRVSLRMFRDIKSAWRVHDRAAMTVEEGAVALRLAGHEVVEIEIQI